MKLRLASLALLALPACEGDAARGDRAATVAARDAPPCPRDQLSCGFQQPVPSDGETVFVNEEFGLSVRFPRGSGVCMTRSGDAPRGFFAVYGIPPNCEERPARTPRAIVVNLSWNGPEYRSIEEAVRTCEPPPPATLRRLGDRPPALAGRTARVCETAGADGSREIVLHAMFPAPGRAAAPGDPPAILAFAAVSTVPAHAEEDFARFREVLASIRISPP